MSWGWYPPYKSVASKKADAKKKIEKLKKTGRVLKPVELTGTKIAKTFWGKAWCTNLERYSDYANRLPRGRSYVKNGFVIDLDIDEGKVVALVSGSDIYTVTVTIKPVDAEHWERLKGECTGGISTLVDLLKGNISKPVMERICREEDGLFPHPNEMKFDCTCPDWATMCKHVAATLYAVGARLDLSPELLFHLRRVDYTELVTGSGAGIERLVDVVTSERVIDGEDIADLFGIEMAPEEVAPTGMVKVKPKAPKQKAAVGPVKKVSAKSKPKKVATKTTKAPRTKTKKTAKSSVKIVAPKSSPKKKATPAKSRMKGGK